MSITFLFGSGADSDYCRSLPSGAAFSSALLTDQYKKQRQCISPGRSNHHSLVRPNSINVFLKTIEAYQSKAEEVLGKECVEKCINYYNSHKNELRDEIHKMCKEWYSAITKENDSEIRNFFLNYAAFFDTLDVKFNSLRSIPLNDNACRVVNAYITIFVLMLHALYVIDDDFEWSWGSIFQLLDRNYDCLTTPPQKLTYYQAVADSNLHCNVVTTNYTDIARYVTKKDSTIYLHGKMTWFEDYKNLTIYDCCKEKERMLALENNENIFPFILIPSGVKPLICKKQIEEFHKFIGALSESDTLCVVGYRFNSEDNHINSIIVEWLRESGKQLIYFNYDNCLHFSDIALFEPFSRCQVAYDVQEGLTIPSNTDIIDIPINKATSISAFKCYLDQCTTK